MSNRADHWTKAAASIEIVTNFISVSYWMASMVDTFAKLDDEIFGISYWGLGFGIFMGLWGAVGSTYCHFKLNTTYQNDDNSLDIEDTFSLTQDNTGALTKSQIVSLAGDAIAHVAETAGPLSFVITLAAPHLARTARISTQVGVTLFGICGAIADVRTCANNLKRLSAA